MSDRSKAEKLALARRKLKEYQRKEKDTSLNSSGSAPRRGATKHVSNDPAKKTTKESFVFDSGPPSVQQECQTSDDGSYCPSPEIKNSEDYCDSFNRNEVNGRSDAVSSAETSQHSLSQHISFPTINPNYSPSVANMFSSSQTINNEAEMFFNNIATPNSLGENSNNYSSFPYQTSSFIEQESIYQKTQSINDVTSLSSHCTSSPSEVTEVLSNAQSGAGNVQTNSHLTGGHIQHDNVTDTFENDSTKTASAFQSNETENCAEVTMAHQRQNLPLYNSSVNFMKETLDEVPLQQPLPQLSSVEEEKKSNFKGDECTSNSNQEKLTVNQKLDCVENGTKSLPLSSTESLRQMSLQINDLISETFNEGTDDNRSSVSELEHRNQELAAMLAVEQQKNEQLHLQLKEHQSRLSQLESELGKVCAESEAQLTRQVGPLQEQLQLHAQTVGILVGEKTELQSALNKSQQLAKQKAGEVEELQGRLKASRHKVTELEKELSVSNTNNQQLHSTVKELSAEMEKLKVENKLVTKHLEETEEEKSEIQQKLNAKMSEISSLQQQLQEKQSQLSLTQLRIQQLSISGNTEMDTQMETLNQQKISLEHQVAQLQQAVRSVTTERDQASQQYQQYVQQLNSQLQGLASKLESATTENENLLSREQSLIHHVSELEKQLQQQQLQQQQSLKTKETSSDDNDKILKLQEKLSDLEEEKKHLHNMNDSQQQQIEELSADLKERLTRIEDLESMIESMKEDQPNKERLLAAIESDKVAAARAVAQNQKLKERLEELEKGFVTMSNTKLELTEKLQYEQHVNKEKGEKVVEMENELKNIRQQLQEKKVALQQLESKFVQTEKTSSDEHDSAEVKQSEQSSLLNQELMDAKAIIEQLKLQNSELRIIVEQQKSLPDTASVHNDKVISSLSASIQQLEAERDSLLSQMQQSKPNNSDTSQSDMSMALHEEPAEMKEAMEKLQEKFKKTMEEVAELSEEKQRLEHLVLQLQGETETIGEYIALYQVQRNILRQRAKENDEQLARVSRDREEMKMKLQELSALVRKLVSEKESSLGHIDVHMDENKLTPVVHPDEAIAETQIQSESEDHSAEVEKSDGHILQENIMNKEATAEKIIALLSEIGSSNLVDPQTTENFHPCPWCSGRLLTV